MNERVGVATRMCDQFEVALGEVRHDGDDASLMFLQFPFPGVTWLFEWVLIELGAHTWNIIYNMRDFLLTGGDRFKHINK